MNARSVGALAALSLSTFAYVATEMLPIGLLRPIGDDLGAAPSAVGLLVGGYGLVVVLTSIPLTQLSRRAPRRPLISGLLAVLTVTTLVSAAARDYQTLFGARVVTALSQALFWSIVVPTAAGLFPARLRGRVVGVVFAGASLAAVLGVPAGTWLGQQAGWRMAFVAVSGVGLAAMLGTAWLLPGGPAADGADARGEAPDAMRYGLLMAMTVLAVTGALAAFTYITLFVVDVAGFSAAAIGPLLFIRGVAGVVGVIAGGALVDRSPVAAIVVSVAAQAVALLGLPVLGDAAVPAALLVGLSGLAFGALTTALSSRVLHVAPVSQQLAAAGASTAVNVGITAGALIGGPLVSYAGVGTAVLVGGLLSVAALGVALVEPFLAWVRQEQRRRPVAAVSPL